MAETDVLESHDHKNKTKEKLCSLKLIYFHRQKRKSGICELHYRQTRRKVSCQ
jgi:hypothetical protein